MKVGQVVECKSIQTQHSPGDTLRCEIQLFTAAVRDIGYDPYRSIYSASPG